MKDVFTIEDLLLNLNLPKSDPIAKPKNIEYDISIGDILLDLDLPKPDYLAKPRDDQLSDYYKAYLSKNIDFQNKTYLLNELIDMFDTLDYYYVYGNEKQKKTIDHYLETVEQKAKTEYGSNLNYYSPSFSFHIPPDVTLEKVPAGVLGQSTLGRAFPGLRLIQILDTLQDDKEQLVTIHEVEHILYPHKTEHEVRRSSEAKQSMIGNPINTNDLFH